jgi:cobalt transporter subunit CbtA
VFVAALAGLVAGIIMTALQTAFTVPLIMQAETFENAESARETVQSTNTIVLPAEAHDYREEAWAPAGGIERALFTMLANIVNGIGFGLILVAASEAAGGIAGLRTGLIWGFGGFAVFVLAPSLGLPPELPAMPAADLLTRQIWWICTVAATAAGLTLIIFFQNEAWLAALGVVLIVGPHIIGAPQPDTHETAVPAGLHYTFVVAVTVTNLLFWLALGAAVAWFRLRFWPNNSA